VVAGEEVVVGLVVDGVAREACPVESLVAGEGADVVVGIVGVAEGTVVAAGEAGGVVLGSNQVCQSAFFRNLPSLNSITVDWSTESVMAFMSVDI